MDNIKQIFAAVFAVMAVILMSTAVFAYSGSGAKSDPYVVYTFDDLKTCMEAGGHVKLGGNISRNDYFYFNIANNTVLDLDGYTLSLEVPEYANRNYAVFRITGKLRIADSGGVIEAKNFTKAAFGVEKNAELIIDSGKIEIDPYYDDSLSGIYIKEGGKFTLNNGSVNCSKSSAVYNDHGTTVINGGTLSSSKKYGLHNVNGSSYIYGGTVNGCYTTCYNLLIYGGDIYNLLNDDYNFFKNIKIYGGNIYKMDLGHQFEDDVLSDIVPAGSTVKVGGATVDKSTSCSKLYNLLDVIVVSSSVNYIPKITIANNVTPYIGKAAVYPQNPDTSLYTLTSSWHQIGSSNEVTSFERGKKYELKLNFAVKNNAYKFAESCYSDFSSVSSALYTLSEANVTDNMCTLTYTFTPTEAGPEITTQPQSYTYYLGESHTFYVSASNAQSYQWHILDENNNELTLDDISQQGWGKVETTAYANLTSLRIASVTMGLNGKKIYCTVTGSNGTATSNTALITVKPEAARITITQQPPETVYFETYDTAKVSIQATGSNMIYSWYFKTPDRTTFLLDEEFKASDWTGSYQFRGTTTNGLTDKYDGAEMYCLVWNRAGQEIESEHFFLKKYNYNVDRNITIRQPKVGETYKNYISDANSIVPAELVIDWDRFGIIVKDKDGKSVKQESGHYSMEDDYVFKAGYKYEFCFNMYLPEHVSTDAIYQFYSKGLIVNGAENGAADSLDEEERSFIDFWTTPVLETDGDVNGNGVVNNADAAMLLKHISGGSTLGSAPLARGDVNSDTEFNMLDVIAILGKES